MNWERNKIWKITHFHHFHSKDNIIHVTIWIHTSNFELTLHIIDLSLTLITAAVKKGSPVQVSMIKTSGIVLSFILQTQNNEDLPSICSLFGAVVISGTALMATLENRINENLKTCSKCCRSSQTEVPQAIV